MASGINNTCRIAGVATGVAALGAVLQSRIESELHGLLPLGGLGATPHALANAIASGGEQGAAAAVPEAARAHVAEIARSAYVSGLNAAFLVGAFVLLFGAVTTLALVRSRDLLHPAPAPASESA
jgi:hypothetical protein